MAYKPGRDDEYSSIVKLELACSDLKSLLEKTAKEEDRLAKMDERFGLIDEALSAASKRVAPLQTSSMAAKALETRINRAVNPALSLLDSFKLSDSLQRKILGLYEELSAETAVNKRLKRMIKYVDCVDQLNDAIDVVCREGEPTIQRLQEAVEFLSRTRAADWDRTQRLRETLVTLKALYETEVDEMRFEGSLDQALLSLQDEYERILTQIKHRNLESRKGDHEIEKFGWSDLGSETEVQVLGKISNTLANNDCMDICIDIYVKVRYKRVAKALMRLSPDYLRTYAPEEIDEMEWECLETAIALWIEHLEVAVRTVFVAEKRLCERVLGGLMDGLVWPECFAKIADKIMAVFFRFGEGVARSAREPQKLFKLLDMLASMERLGPDFAEVFAGEDISARFRELVKLLVHASSKVFWEFGLRIEGNSDGFPPPPDGSVPKLVRYAVNFLKYLAADEYRSPMTKVLRTERAWKSSVGSGAEGSDDGALFRDAVANAMEALERNVESKRRCYRDGKVVSFVFAMNTYWYIYMRTKNSELAGVLGEQYMKTRYKALAEESAYLYQKQGWGDLAAALDKKDLEGLNSKEEVFRGAREKVLGFVDGFDEVLKSHRGVYCIADGDLREQIREATVKLVVSSYKEFVGSFPSTTFRGMSFLSPEAVEARLRKFFDGTSGKIGRRDRDRDRTVQKSSTSAEGELRDFRRSEL